MKKKVVISFSTEAWERLESLTQKANENFDTGSVNYSDVINELIPAAQLDIRLLQARHTNVRKSLKHIASKKDIDLDAAIKSLMELQAMNSKQTKTGEMQ